MAVTTVDIHDATVGATEFLSALALQDWTAAQAKLDPGVTFRVLTPRGLREADDDAGAMEWLVRWFGDADELTVLDSTVSMMHDTLAVSYRFRVHKDRWYVIEQRGYADVVGGRITCVRLVCSGFRPES